MSLIQWVGFVERYVLEEDIYLQIPKPAGKESQAGKPFLVVHRQEKGDDGSLI